MISTIFFGLACILLCATMVMAEGVNVQLFNHSHSPNYIMTEDTLSKNSLINNQLIFSANYNYIEDPIVATNPARTERTRTILEGMGTLHLGAGYQTSSRLLLGVSTFGAEIVDAGFNKERALGDTTLIAKYRLTSNYAPTSFAIIPTITLPTGDERLFTSDGGVGYGAKFAAEHDFGKVRINANLGYMRNPQAIFENIDYRSRVLYALGAHITIDDNWRINLEAAGSRALNSLDDFQNPGELYAGAQHFITKGLSAVAGLSVGSLNSINGGDYRILTGLKYQPPFDSSPTIKFKNLKMTKRQKKSFEKIQRLKQKIQFKHGSDDLTEDSKLAIVGIKDLLEKDFNGIDKIVIEGHANKIGPEAFNQKLSEHRAMKVMRFLVESGIRKNIVETIGHGESIPIRHKDKKKELRLSRRVEFKVLKKVQQ